MCCTRNLSAQPPVGNTGLHRFTPEQIRAIFGSQLQVRAITETVYQGMLDPLPRALFCVMQREG
jgi:hypothetical protein